MIKLFRQVLKVGEATIPYPFEPLSIAPGFRGKPQHNPEACIACAACTIACPSNALGMSNDSARGIRTWSFCVGRCIFCGRCEEVCPTGAISLSPEFELAVMKKADLDSHANFKLSACHVCHRYFAPAKEIDYVLSLLKQAGLPEDQLQDRRALLETCPECKRRQGVQDVERVLTNLFPGVAE
jgi:formate hydrogenlyase subunit 6/NADH:ubiquinone oxidoreductase subunit I